MKLGKKPAIEMISSTNDDTQAPAKRGRPRLHTPQDSSEVNAPRPVKRGRPKAALQAQRTSEETGQNATMPKGKPRGGKGKRKKLGHGVTGIPPVAPPPFAGSSSTQSIAHGHGAPLQSRNSSTVAQGGNAQSAFGNLHFISTNSLVNKAFQQTSNTVSILD